jgi:hypothetical protein
MLKSVCLVKMMEDRLVSWVKMRRVSMSRRVGFRVWVVFL